MTILEALRQTATSIKTWAESKFLKKDEATADDFGIFVQANEPTNAVAGDIWIDTINDPTVVGGDVDDKITNAVSAEAMLRDSADRLLDSKITAMSEHTHDYVDTVMSDVAKYTFTIPAGESYTIIFDSGLHNALISCRAAVANRYASFVYSGYSIGGVRSNIYRIYGDAKITYGVRPDSTDGTNGMTLWNHGEHPLTCTVFSFIGTNPTAEAGDGGAIEVTYEHNHPDFVPGVEYCTTDRHNGTAVYKRLTTGGVLQYKVGESGTWKNYSEMTGANAYVDSKISTVLPSVTTADNGKVLMVVDGKWKAVDLTMSIDTNGVVSV